MVKHVGTHAHTPPLLTLTQITGLAAETDRLYALLTALQSYHHLEGGDGSSCCCLCVRPSLCLWFSDFWMEAEQRCTGWEEGVRTNELKLLHRIRIMELLPLFGLTSCA